MSFIKMKFWQAIVVVSSLALVSVFGCGSTKPKSKEVVVDEPAPPLEVPPDLFKPELSQSMTIPKLSAKQKGQMFVMSTDNVKVQRDGGVRWLVVNSDPTVIWPRVEQFWGQLGHQVERKDVSLGIMETDWLVDENTGIKKNSTTMQLQRNKYRARIEKGRDVGTTEIYVTHRAQFQTKEGSSIFWKSMPADREMEVEIIHRLLVFLGMNKSEAKFLIDPTHDTEMAMRLETGKGQLIINTGDSLDRVWRKLGLALDRGGYTIADRSLEKASYRIDIDDPPKKLNVSLTKVDKIVSISLTGSNGEKLKAAMVKPILSSIRANI